MAETSEPRTTVAPAVRRSRRLKASDIIIFGVILVVIVVLVATIIGRLSLKHEVSAAQAVSDKVISRIAHDDAAGVRALADQKFQHDHSATELAPLLKPISQIYGQTTPTIDQQIVANTKKAQNVVFVYKYNRLKLPFYVRVTISKPKGNNAWQLVNFGGNADETTLLNG